RCADRRGWLGPRSADVARQVRGRQRLRGRLGDRVPGDYPGSFEPRALLHRSDGCQTYATATSAWLVPAFAGIIIGAAVGGRATARRTARTCAWARGTCGTPARRAAAPRDLAELCVVAGAGMAAHECAGPERGLPGYV